MNRQVFMIFRCVSVLALLWLLTGCFGRNAPDVTYYSLLTMQQLGQDQTIADLPGISIGVGPITIPESLKRAQVATRDRGNQYDFDEFNRWAGVLERDVATVLGENLGHLLGVNRIADFPWMPYFSPTYRVFVDIQRLDGELGGDAVLHARWGVANAEGKELLTAKKFAATQPLAEANYAALIKAESELLARLSVDIAKEVVTTNK